MPWIQASCRKGHVMAIPKAQSTFSMKLPAEKSAPIVSFCFLCCVAMKMNIPLKISRNTILVLVWYKRYDCLMPWDKSSKISVGSKEQSSVQSRQAHSTALGPALKSKAKSIVRFKTCGPQVMTWFLGGKNNGSVDEIKFLQSSHPSSIIFSAWSSSKWDSAWFWDAKSRTQNLKLKLKQRNGCHCRPFWYGYNMVQDVQVPPAHFRCNRFT